MKSSDNFFQQFKQISKTIAIILSWTIFALLVLIIGFLAYYMVSANIYAKKGEKFEPKFSLYTIVSPSMEPNIKVYDVILNTRIDDPADIKVGDVITFISTSTISNGMTVTHRVTRIVNGPEGLEFATKGDNNTIEDTDTAKAKNLLGKVVLKIPQLGRLQFFLSTKGGWLLVILFPALLIIVNDIFKIFKLNKAKKNLNEAEKSSEDKEEKIKLETFRKEEIKEKINNKDLKKAKELEKKLKNNKKKSTDISKEVEETEKTNNIDNPDKIEEDVEFIPVLDEKEIKEIEEKISEKPENLIESENNKLNDSIKENSEPNDDAEILKEEEIIFEPVLNEEEINNLNSDDKIDEKEIEKKLKNNKKKSTDISEEVQETKKTNESTLKTKNIFDEEEQQNIFTDENIPKVFSEKEPIKKENNIPLDFELPKLKNTKWSIKC